MKKETKEIYDNFISRKCFCGAPKVQNQSFCRPCYMKLPQKLKDKLWNRFYQGYQEAFNQALEILGLAKNEKLDKSNS